MKGNGNPWIGLSSYNESMVTENNYMFCGRTNAVQELFSLVDNNLLITLYGKSGVGKTSVLQAGLFPKLRMNKYVPYIIRLGLDGTDIPYAQIITDTISPKKWNCGSISVASDDVSYLQQFFCKSEFLQESGQTVYPVIVLDQFEELFFKDTSRLETLLKQLYALIDDRTLQADGLSQFVTNYRFIISMREDDFFRLEDVIDRLRLNEMKYNRYRLKELSAEEAKEVISAPSEGCFNCTDLNDISGLLIESTKDSNGEVNTAMLSLTCNRLYEKACSDSAFPISKEYVEKFLDNTDSDFLEQFYNEIKVRLSIPSRWYFLEDELLTESGRRRTVTESELLHEIPDAEFLFYGQHALLRYVTLETQRERMVELLHDTLAKTMMASRTRRKQQEYIRQQKRRNYIKTGVLCIALCLSGLFAFLCLKMSVMNRSLTITQSRYLVSEALALKDEGNVAKAIRLLLYALPGDRSNERNTTNRPDVEEARFALYEMMWGGDDNVAFRHQTAVIDAIFSHDGKYVATVSSNNEIRVWDAVTGADVCKPVLNKSSVRRMVFTDDGNALVYVLWNGMFYKWDFMAEKSEEIGKPLSLYVDAADFDAAGRTVAVRSSYGDLLIWDISRGKELPVRLSNCEIPVFDMDPEGKRIAVTEDTGIRIYDTDTEENVALPMQCEISYLLFSPNGRYLIAVSESEDSDEVIMWDLNSSRISFMKKVEKGLRCATWSHDSRLLAVISQNNSLDIWDIDNGNTVLHQEDYPASKISFSPTGERMLSVNKLAKITPVVLDADKPYSAKVSDMCSCPSAENNYIATIESWNDLVRVWDFETDAKICSLKHSQSVASAEFSRNGKYIATIAGRSVHVWDIQSEKEICPPIGHQTRVIATAFSPDAKHIVTASRDSLVRIWDIGTGNSTILPIPHENMVVSISYAPGGNKLVTASQDSCALIWDVNTGRSTPIRNIGGIIYTAQFSPDGRSVLTTSSDNTAILWDALEGTQSIPALKHDSRISAASFSPDGKYIVTSSIDGTVRIWDSADGLPLTAPIRHKSPVRNAMFSPDGKYVASVTMDGNISFRRFMTIDEILSQYHDDLVNNWALTEKEMRDYSIIK